MANIISVRESSNWDGPVIVTVFDREPTSEQLAKVTGHGLSAEWASGETSLPDGLCLESAWNYRGASRARGVVCGGGADCYGCTICVRNNLGG